MVQSSERMPPSTWATGTPTFRAAMEQVALSLQQYLLVANHDVRGLFRLGTRANFQVDARLGNAELFEKTAGHGAIVVLAGVNQAVPEPTPLRLDCLQCIDNRRDLHEVGACAGDEINALHFLASINMNTYAHQDSSTHVTLAPTAPAASTV
jgi:hypothetical protein